MAWTEKDLDDLRKKGYKIDDIKIVDEEVLRPKKKIEKISIEKRTIALILQQLKDSGLILDFVEEHRFDKVRRFRFDWAIPSLMIGIEYEGLMSKKSRHTTKTGYTKDTEKYNLSAINGWTVLRYTAINYKDFKNNILQLIEVINNNTSELP